VHVTANDARWREHRFEVCGTTVALNARKCRSAALVLRVATAAIAQESQSAKQQGKCAWLGNDDL
jgi:hypothetical protein